MKNSTATSEQQFSTKRIFIKDFSLEVPGGASTFTNPWDPDVTVDLDVTSELLSNDHHEVVLTLTIVVANANSTAFMIELFQAGIFFCTGYSEQELHQILHTVCPNLLFPYASEAVDTMVLKASFPALVLDPVNFAALYEKKLEV